MKAMQLNPEEHPILSKWETEHLNNTLENLAQKTNPSKSEVTEADNHWAATMLEMDLQAQSGAIWETETEKEDPMVEHNRKMLKKMREENIPWAESYPGDLYPIDEDPKEDFPR
ncbi:hypothetical protein [Chryseobacterium sp. CCH4-E10]|uniref:hypothetical protein n=1 Tax=Chryseobacterium sp. CCH4-E10 TaxID=1768758 RepID=UPI001E506BCB|nr:hypothetical protein [Chryseobacterium sp. CCH4-E10]